jgi:hypothetical protein
MVTVIVRWCDVCMAGDQQVPGAAHAVQLDARSGTVDLCPEHVKELLGPLLDILVPAPRAASTTGRKPEPGASECLLCDQSLRPERMAPHLVKAHDTTVGDIYGLACPVCGREMANASGAGSHAQMHGVKLGGLVGLWTQVVQSGDPDGKWADLRASWPAGGSGVRHTAKNTA